MLFGDGAVTGLYTSAIKSALTLGVGSSLLLTSTLARGVGKPALGAASNVLLSKNPVSKIGHLFKTASEGITGPGPHLAQTLLETKQSDPKVLGLVKGAAKSGLGIGAKAKASLDLAKAAKEAKILEGLSAVGASAILSGGASAIAGAGADASYIPDAASAVKDAVTGPAGKTAANAATSTVKKTAVSAAAVAALTSAAASKDSGAQVVPSKSKNESNDKPSSKYDIPENFEL